MSTKFDLLTFLGLCYLASTGMSLWLLIPLGMALQITLKCVSLLTATSVSEPAQPLLQKESDTDSVASRLPS